MLINRYPRQLLNMMVSAVFYIPIRCMADEITVTQGVIEVIGTRDDFSEGIDQSEMELNQANDLEGLCSSTPNLTVGGSQKVTQKIYLRGIEDTKLSISIDGASQAGQVFQAQGRLAVEPMLLKRVQITQGAGSALDGFGALGGAIEFSTKDADDFLRENQQYGAAFTARHTSNNQGTYINTDLFGRLSERWSALASLGGNKAGNLQDGSGNSYSHTGTDSSYRLLKLSGDLSKHTSLNLSYENQKDEGIRALRPIFQVSDWNPKGWQANNRETITGTYQFHDPAYGLDASVNGYKTHNFVSILDGAERLEGYIDSYGLDIRNSSASREHDLTYGYAQRFDKGVFSTRHASEEGWLSGLYFQAESPLGESLLMSYGGRYDYYQLDTYSGQRFTAKGVSPNINLEYLLSDFWAFKMGYAQSLRGPSVKQVFAIKSSPTGMGLKEEKASNAEISLEYADDSLHAGLGIFVTEIEDVVGFEGTIGPQNRIYENLGDLKTSGYRLWFERNWDKTKLRANYSVTDPELNGKPLNDKYVGVGTAFGDRFIVQASHFLWEYNLELGWQGTFVKALNNPDPITGKKSGYGVHNLYMQWWPADDRWGMTLSVNNLFDHFYYDHATFRYEPDSGDEIGIPASGRDIRLSLSWYM